MCLKCSRFNNCTEIPRVPLVFFATLTTTFSSSRSLPSAMMTRLPFRIRLAIATLQWTTRDPLCAVSSNVTPRLVSWFHPYLRNAMSHIIHRACTSVGAALILVTNSRGHRWGAAGNRYGLGPRYPARVIKSSY